MFLLPPRIRRALESKRGRVSRVFSFDTELITAISDAAREQGRSEEEILVQLIGAGQERVFGKDDVEAHWDSLSEREQEVLALACLNQRNYEIAEILGIAPETVKTHLQNIFRKFGLRSKKELRLLLKDWDFAGWWDARQP